jgi:NADH dehydrogenase [ubiquinone] 1 alpha subcomplex assembly factor 3
VRGRRRGIFSLVRANAVGFADLLILGTGTSIQPLEPETRQRIADMGMRLEVLDTRNASAQFNLLAVERGVDQIATALLPLGWGS